MKKTGTGKAVEEDLERTAESAAGSRTIEVIPEKPDAVDLEVQAVANVDIALPQRADRD